MKKSMVCLLASGISLIGMISTANASKVLSADMVVGNTLGTLPYEGINTLNMINRSGLSVAYVSGVTDWDAYFAQSPTQAQSYYGNEWFGGTQLTKTLNNGPTSITGYLDFDLGGIYNVDGLALWNEDSFGIGKFDVYTSLDGSNWGVAIVENILPTNWDYDTPYKADEISWIALDARFIRLSITEAGFKDVTDEFGVRTQKYGVAIGEIAFSGTQPVPEPATLVLMGLGLAGLVGRRISGKRK